MFRVDVRRIYGGYSYWNISSFTRVLSLTGFDAFNFTASLSQTSKHTYPYQAAFRPQPFSLVLFLTAQSSTQLIERIKTVKGAFFQYTVPSRSRQLIIWKEGTSNYFAVPVVVESVSVTKQAGLSAEITITGFRTTMGLIGAEFGGLERYSVSTSTSELPKSLSLPYEGSFPAPLRIILTGPINAGFSIARNEGISEFDFTLTVGTNIPPGVVVEIDYGSSLINGKQPVVNARYLNNPEICPDIVARPKPVNNSVNNEFSLTGTSSSGTITIEVEPMYWSVYE